MAKKRKYRAKSEKLSMEEKENLVEILKSEYGFEPTTAVMAIAEHSARKLKFNDLKFNVILQSPGSAKLKVVKTVKNLLDMGLIEAQELVNSTPSILESEVSELDSYRMRDKLEEAGAKVTLQMVRIPRTNIYEDPISSILEKIVQEQIQVSADNLEDIGKEIYSMKSSIRRMDDLINSKIR